MKLTFRFVVFVILVASICNVGSALANIQKTQAKLEYNQRQHKVLHKKFLQRDNALHQSNYGNAPTESISPYIVGGEPAPDGQWPFMVSIRYAGAGAYDGHFCGGSLVRKNVVLTAAHCVKFEEPESIEVFIGSNKLSGSAEGAAVSVKKIITHAGFDFTHMSNDVALLFLDRPVDYPIVPLINDEQMNALAQGDTFLVAGWGNMNPDEPLFPNDLQQVEIEYVDQNVCQDAYEKIYGAGSVDETMVCAGSYQGGKDSCHGDSGGPLVMSTEEGIFQVGIVSWGLPTCAMTGYYGVYSRVAFLRNWIEKNIDRTLADFQVADSNLQACINQHAQQNNWQRIDDVSYLYCDNMGVESLEGIENYTSITDFSLAHNSIFTFTPLENLKNLVSLDLSNTGIADLDALLSLTDLQQVSLSGNDNISCLNTDAGPFTYNDIVNSCGDFISIDNIIDPNLRTCIKEFVADQEIQSMDDLDWLSCYNREITSLEGLEEYKSLDYIDLSSNDIRDVGNLAALPNLETLYLDENRNLDLSSLSGLNGLISLGLSYNALVDVADLVTLENLYYLSFNGNPDSNIADVIPQMNSLQALGIADNQLRSATFLERLPLLESLDVSGNPDLNLESLSNLTSLTSLSMLYMDIDDISPISSLTQLFELQIQYNNVKSIEPVKNFKHMDVFRAYDNQISDLRPLKMLFSLWELDIGENEISDISPLADLINLEYISLYGNDGISCMEVTWDFIRHADIPDNCFIPPTTDTDADGIYDNDDNCPTKPNANQRDTDADGMGDRCDIDDDNDGFTDPEENRVGSNPKDPSSTPESILIDKDGDGILNDVDNCIDVKNWNQKDYDLDGLGNRCDLDDDNDGYIDAQERVEGSNPYNPLSTPETVKTDKDGDGIPNIWDNCVDKYNPNQVDRDQDGEGNRCDLDDDNDGFTDEEEIAAGTNPRNPNSYPLGLALWRMITG